MLTNKHVTYLVGIFQTIIVTYLRKISSVHVKRRCNIARFFSKMKIITNHLRNCMLQPRLSALSIMSIEFDLLDKIDFSLMSFVASLLRNPEKCF